MPSTLLDIRFTDVIGGVFAKLDKECFVKDIER
jgi:hypothetical protein